MSVPDELLRAVEGMDWSKRTVFLSLAIAKLMRHRGLGDNVYSLASLASHYVDLRRMAALRYDRQEIGRHEYEQAQAHMYLAQAAKLFTRPESDAREVLDPLCRAFASAPTLLLEMVEEEGWRHEA